MASGRLAEDGVELHARFNVIMVLVSFALAFLGGYMAVSLADQYRIAYELKPKFMSQSILLMLMSICVGGVAIWSMHFVGMGALILETPDGDRLDKYCDPLLTMLSLLSAVVFVYIGLLFAAKGREYSKDKARIFKMILKDAKKLSMQSAQSKFTVWRIALLKDIHNILIGGVITAAGVCVMHYIGMVAFLKDAEVKWNWGIVVASVLIAVVAATAAFWILFSALPLRPDMEILRVMAGVIAAVAVCGMHYTGMVAATYTYKYDNHDAIVGESADMTTAAWGALVAGMGFLWMMTVFLLTDLRAWHLTLDSIVSKTDDLMEDINTGKLSGKNVVHQYRKYRHKLVERLATDSNAKTSSYANNNSKNELMASPGAAILMGSVATIGRSNTAKVYVSNDTDSEQDTVKAFGEHGHVAPVEHKASPLTKTYDGNETTTRTNDVLAVSSDTGMV